MWREKLFLICSVMLVSSEYQNGEEESPRKGKLFTFNTLDDDIKLDLDFTIPFLTIPVKKTVDSVSGFWSGPTININPATLALGGAFIFGTTVLLPFALKTYAAHYPYERYSRILDNTKFGSDAVLDLASRMLADGQTISDCALRIACWTAQRSKIDALKLWHQAVSNSILTTMINTTAIEEAMLSGKKGRDCGTYARCPMTEEHIKSLLSNLAVLTNSVG